MSSVTDPKDVEPGTVPDDPLTGHSYDGIQEFDNPLPGWWKWLFVATIAFAPPYLLYYHSGAEGRAIADRYDDELAENLRLQFAEIGELKPNRETLVEFLYKPNWLQVGKTVFQANCTQCHGNNGEGKVGPNLTDDHYKNIREIGDFITILQKGANAGAMPAWQNRMTDNELLLTAAYAASLRWTEVENGKPPEGREIGPWPEAPPEPEEAEGGDDNNSPENESGASASGTT